MTVAANEPTVQRTVEIRETYEAYVVRGERVGMIADPERTHAWIQSDHTVDIEP